MTTSTPDALDPHRDYPIGARRPDLLRTPTGKPLEDITMDAVRTGEVAPEDLRIAPETLRLQARVAEQAGRGQLAQNFRRAAELSTLPDELVLRIYNSLRPYASTKQQLTDIADELETKFTATLCAQLVREAGDVYQRREILASRKAESP